ncbi:MAG TPA: SDR family NAD(P)-dependent oxidoreductase [Candidatus Angelobacter sp.]|nr:SDR family NAD(P)-dependent oxidoreductase [Candidatus Angelobacter sp.]
MILQGQVAIVTGAGQGIGKAISLRFAKEGADIGILDINRETATKTSEEIHQEGRRSVVMEADVSNHDQAKFAIDQVADNLGRIDILVNNAGIEKRGPFLEITPQDWKRQLDVNLSGTFYCSQAAAHHMVRRNYGRIINISSVAGLIGPIDLAAYGAAKAGIVGLTRASALDLSDYGITVNAIAPGPVETELMLGAWTAEALKERPQHGMIARFGTVNEIAHAALFLASPESGFITGITLPVEGGAVAGGGYMVEKYRRRKLKKYSTGNLR